MNKNTIIALIATTIMLASLFGGCGIDKRTVSVKTATVKKTTTTIKVKFKTNSDYKRSLIKEAGIVYSPKKSTLAYTYGTTKDSEKYKTVENMGTKPATQFSAAKSAKVKVKKKLGKKKTFKRTLKVKNLEPGTKYYYRAFVKAKYYGQNGKTWETYQYYKVKSFKTKGKAPFVSAVPFLSANFGKIFPAPPVVLAWGKVKNALGYEVYKSVDGSSYEKIYPAAYTEIYPDPKITTITDHHVGKTHTYRYKIRAFKDDASGQRRYSKYTAAKIEITDDSHGY